MEMAIIEAVLALVALYLVMALLASQLNEQISGLMGTRQGYTGKLIKETFPGEGGEIQVEKFYAYPPVFSLSKGSGRPSAIPAELFAEAWLAVLYGKDKPPRADFRSPSEFIASLDLPAGRMKQVVDWLAAGYGDDWDRFERRIQTWYGDICDRSEGWFKRFTAFRLWGISLALAAVLNVDTQYIFNFLMTHEDQRTALANLGELINATAGGASAPAGSATRAAPPAAATALTPYERAQAANADLATALAAIDRAMADPVVAGAGDDLHAAAQVCHRAIHRIVKDKDKDASPTSTFFDRSESWPVLLMGVRTLMGEAALGVASPETAAPPCSTGSAPRTAPGAKATGARPAPAPATASCAVSGAVSAAAATALGEAPDSASSQTANGTASAAEGARALSADEVTLRWRTASVCLDRVSQWVDATWARTRTPASRKALEEGRAAFGRMQRYLETERQRSTGAASLRRRYMADPQGVRDCIEQAGADRSAFAQCLRVSTTSQLPLGWPMPMEQLCSVTAVPEGRTATLRGEGSSCAGLPANPALGLTALDAQVDGGRVFGIVAGWLITAFMVSLGAPFWFGVLGKVANLRLAGRVRGSRDGGDDDPPPPDASSLRSATPLSGAAPAAPAVQGAARAATIAGVAVPAAPFSDARNSFEQTLRLQDISRLQKALDAPPTGRLDALTRERLRQRLGDSEELDPGSFEAITGRRAPVAVVAAPVASDVWTLGHQAGDEGISLRQALNRCFPTLAPLAVDDGVFDAEVRNRAVLHRLLSGTEPDWLKRQVVMLATQRDPSLDTLDAARRRQILDTAAPLPLGALPAWLCTALGELGVFERPGASQSNPRIDEYIRAIGNERMANDETAWCGAFVGWVLKRHGMLSGEEGSLAPYMTAERWSTFGVEVTAFADLQPGDVCVMPRGDRGHHVAFFVDRPPGSPDGSAYLLGGNQGSGGLVGAVTLVRWRGVDKAVWRRPL